MAIAIAERSHPVDLSRSPSCSPRKLEGWTGTSSTGQATSFQQRYCRQKLLHKSLFGEVVLANDELSNESVVIKTSNRIRVDGNEDPSNEARLLRKIEQLGGHNNIVRLLYHSEDEKQIRIVMEYLTLDLFKYVQEKGGIPEKEACEIFGKIVQGVKFLHSNGIAHLDLSLENVLLEKDGTVKLCDFGAAREVKHRGRLKNLLAGKLNYAAPEILDNRPFDPFKADMYSLGSMLFMLLCGHPIYDLDNENGRVAMRYATSGSKSLQQLLQAYGYSSDNAKTPSNEAVDLIAGLLTREPSIRLSLEQLIDHPWMQGSTE